MSRVSRFFGGIQFINHSLHRNNDNLPGYYRVKKFMNIIINIFFSIFRRPLFNWLHWFVGNSAHIVGIVTIFFAVSLDKAELPKETDYLLIAFVIFHALIHLIMSCLVCKSETADRGYQTKPSKNG